MKIFHNSTENKSSNDFTGLFKEITNTSSLKEKKYQFEDLILNQKDYDRAQLLLDNKDIIVIEDNYHFYKTISNKLNFVDFTNYLDTIDIDSLESSYELLLMLETFFKTINDEKNFETAINIFHSIIIEVGIQLFLDLIYNICYTTNNEIISKIFEYVQQKSLTYPFLEIFNSDQERIALEHGHYMVYSIKPEFDFLSYFSNITFNQQIMKEMKARKIDFDLYRDHMFILRIFDEDNSIPTERNIIKAICNDDVDSLQQIMNSSPDSFASVLKFHNNMDRFNYEMSLTDLAAYYGSIKCFKFLLLNHAIQCQMLPCFAILGQNAEIIHICDQNNLFCSDKIKRFSLEAAFLVHNVDVFQWLTENKSMFESSYFQKFFSRSIETSNYNILNYIYEYFNDSENGKLLDVEFNDKSLHAICKNNNIILLKWFIKKVGSLSEKQIEMCFCAAAKRGNPDFLNFIFDLGIEKYDKFPTVSPLHYLTISGDIEIIEKTLNLNRKVLNVALYIERNLNLTPLMIAFKHKRYDIANFFLSQKDLDINALGSICEMYLSIDVFNYVCILNDEKAFSMLLNKKLLSKLQIGRKCIMYRGRFDMLEITHETMFKNCKNEFFCKNANKFK